jgi:hypothetical protein
MILYSIAKFESWSQVDSKNKKALGVLTRSGKKNLATKTF